MQYSAFPAIQDSWIQKGRKAEKNHQGKQGVQLSAWRLREDMIFLSKYIRLWQQKERRPIKSKEQH